MPNIGGYMGQDIWDIRREAAAGHLADVATGVVDHRLTDGATFSSMVAMLQTTPGPGGYGLRFESPFGALRLAPWQVVNNLEPSQLVTWSGQSDARGYTWLTIHRVEE